MRILIELPWPPSVNTYWRTYQGRMIISAAGRKYRKDVQDAVMLQKANKHMEGSIKVEIMAMKPDNRKRDLDNLLKATLDSLSHAGVYLDDSQITDLRIFWGGEKGGKLFISLEQL
jgi:crossover junction endodeoxyribonuclease RusA